MAAYSKIGNLAQVSFLCVISLTGCEGSKRDTAALIGAGVCSAAGTYLGGNLPTLVRSAAIGGSALICGYIGQQIGDLLDEQDRQTANKAAQQALATGKVQRWSNPETKTSGKSTIIGTSSKLTDKGRRPCKTSQNTVTLADGKSFSENMTICQGADGQWQPQSDTATASGPAPADSSATGGVLDTAKEKAGELYDKVKGAF